MGAAGELRRLIDAPGCVVAPDAHDVMVAKLVEQAGFPAVYVGSFGVAASRFGLPDQSFLSVDQLVDAARIIAGQVSIPVVLDLENGGNDAVACRRHVGAAIDAGVAGVQIEDQAPPKNLGLGTARLHELDDSVARIQAAVDARGDRDIVVNARAEGLLAGASIEETQERCVAYRDAGADLITVGGLQPENVRAFAEAIGAPIAGWVYEATAPSELEKLGFSMAIYAGHTALITHTTVRAFLSQLASAEGGLTLDEHLTAAIEVLVTVGGDKTPEMARRFGLIS